MKTKKNPLKQLVYLRYYTGNGQMATNNQFRQQLLNNVSSELAPEKEIKKLKYHQSDLTKHFLKYNKITLSKKKLWTTLQENKKPKPIKDFFPFVLLPEFLLPEYP